MSAVGKSGIGRAFGKAAKTYDDFAGVQRAIADRLIERIAPIALPTAARVLEIGCGTGYLTRALRDLCPADSVVLATDLSPAMVEACRATLDGRNGMDFLVADGERHDFGRPFDLIVSNLALQWFDDPLDGAASLARRLHSGGTMALTMLGPRTFSEWRADLAAHGLGDPIRRFPAPEDVERALRPFGELRVETWDLTAVYPSALGFLRAIKGIGAATAAPGHVPFAAGALRRVLRRSADADFPVTYQAIAVVLEGK